MHGHDAQHRRQDVQAPVRRDAHQHPAPCPFVTEQAEEDARDTEQEGVEHHRLDVELDVLPCLRADAGDAHHDQLRDLAHGQGLEDEEFPQYPCQPPQYRPVVQRSEHQDLEDQREIDDHPEHGIHLDLFFRLLHDIQFYWLLPSSSF